jgi:nucleotide-binding universal stress UspA family protein
MAAFHLIIYGRFWVITEAFPDFVPEESFVKEARALAEQHLAKCHAVLTGKGIKSTTSVEIGNDVVGSIMEVVDREHIDMVVISTHGISGWHPLIFGSIAEKVVKLVQCPLLLLRSVKPDQDLKTPAGNSVVWW